jgi:hypothetical protein
MRSRRLACVVIAALGGLVPLMATRAQQSPERYPGLLDEHPAIQYAIRPVHDRVARLNAELQRGARTLVADGPGRYLRAVLDALQVSADSQVLVFSKTGIQGSATGPRNPRALYYDDDVVVGYIPGARVLELAAQDPEQGVVFYTLDQTSPATPMFERRTTCLSCHVSASTLEVPGMIVRSHEVSAEGSVFVTLGRHSVSHETPLAERWGGWFVTGRYTAPPYAGVLHRGNTTVAPHGASEPSIMSNEVWIEWLASMPEAKGYPSGSSDIASLLTFDHQMHAMNLLTRVNWEARVAAARQANAGDPALRPLIDELVDYLLFVDEVPPPARVVPPPGFAERFVARGARDRRGRSLRELDLDRRLLRYPCSYMIESAAFDRLPGFVKRAIYERLRTILQAREAADRYAHLTRADRRAILEILGDIKPDFRHVRPADSTARPARPALPAEK